jgi:hypothetical protein
MVNSGKEIMFEVILPNVASATATDEGCALYAAHTLVNENARAAGGARMLRREIIITCDGIYHGRLTTMAQAGRTS